MFEQCCKVVNNVRSFCLQTIRWLFLVAHWLGCYDFLFEDNKPIRTIYFNRL